MNRIMKYEKKDIITLYESKKLLKFIFFWGHSEHSGNITKACLSQWYPCEFIKDDVVYSTAEQYMMAQKALLFQDTDTYDKIMEAEHPKKYQSLGRKVKNFSEAVWNQHKYNIVVEGNLCKFSQNEKLKSFYLEQTQEFWWKPVRMMQYGALKWRQTIKILRIPLCGKEKICLALH